jgi:hypothetical protein
VQRESSGYEIFELPGSPRCCPTVIYTLAESLSVIALVTCIANCCGLNVMSADRIEIFGNASPRETITPTKLYLDISCVTGLCGFPKSLHASAGISLVGHDLIS